MKIRFLQTYKVQAENGETYQAGEVYDLPELSARHFLRKGRAEIVVESTVTTPAVMPPEVQEAINKTESRKLGERGGDLSAKYGKAQKTYRKRSFEGDE